MKIGFVLSVPHCKPLLHFFLTYVFIPPLFYSFHVFYCCLFSLGIHMGLLKSLV